MNIGTGLALTQRRLAFEHWMTDVHGYPPSDLVWQEKRNCYADYRMHLAWQAWQDGQNQTTEEVSKVLYTQDEVQEVMELLWRNHSSVPDDSLRQMEQVLLTRASTT